MPSRLGSPKLTLRRAAGRVDAELVAQPAEDPEHLRGRRSASRRSASASGSTMTSSRGMPWSAARSTIRFATAKRTSGSSEMPVSSLRDRDDCRAVLPHERQDALEPLLLAGHRVDERLALVGGEPRLERLDDRRVDRQRHIGERLHELDRLRQDRGLVGERDAGVDVEHVRAGLDLGQRVALDPAEVAGLHLLGEQLPAGRVDALADDHERPVEADDDLARGRADDGVGHGEAAVRSRRPGSQHHRVDAPAAMRGSFV